MGVISTKEFNNMEFLEKPHIKTNVDSQSEYSGPERKTFKMKEKISIHADSFDITNEYEERIFQIKSKGTKKELLSKDGKVLGKIREQFFSVNKKTYIFDEQNNVRAIIRRRLLTDSADIWILNTPANIKEIKRETKERKPDLVLRNNWRAKKFLLQPNSSSETVQITPCYMKIRGTSTVNCDSRKIFSRDAYILQVAPNFDSRLAVLLAVAVDEIYRDCSNAPFRLHF